MTAYYKIEQSFRTLPIEEEGEPIEFSIESDTLTISREHTQADKIDPKKWPEIDGFEASISIEEAKMLRDFLNFALPSETT